MSEVWRNIPGYPRYQASTTGCIRSIGLVRGQPGRVLKPWTQNNGYQVVGLCLGSGTQQERHLVHRLIAATFIGPLEGLMVDHITCDRSDNRPGNLRFCNPSGNSRNQLKRVRQETSSAYKGVSWDYQRARWFACIRTEGRTKALGRFRTEREAALAYDAAARFHFGSFARLNFPEPGERSALAAAA